MPLSLEASEAIEFLCEQLTERRTTLFLGAGVNAGILDADGVPCPLGNDLARMICRDLLEAPDAGLALDESVEIARHRVGERVVNGYLYDRFEKYRPGLAQLALVQLPWDTIYTTNYDQLLEKGSTDKAIRPAGRLVPIVSATASLAALNENDIPYYKLHGSIESANTPEGRLILTKDDYRFYELHRKPLFKRLYDDLLSRSMLFVGYGLKDQNFRGIIEDCRNAAPSGHLQASFAVVHAFTQIEETFWKDKYNLQLIACDVVEFCNAIRDMWGSDNYTVLPLEERKGKEYLKVAESVSFPKVTDAFYRLEIANCGGQSDPTRFYRGGEPTWSDIRDRIAAPRDLFSPLLDAMFEEMLNPKRAATAHLITGPAGTGKTTLLQTMAYFLAEEFGCTVLVHIPGTPLDTRALLPLVNANELKRVFIVVKHGGECYRDLVRFLRDSRERKLPVTLLVEERKNQWIAAAEPAYDSMQVEEYEFDLLSRAEIGEILERLDRFNLLGRLAGASLDDQVEHFENLAGQDLLVALHELTSEGGFRRIVIDEYEKIPSAKAKAAYLYVSALGQIDQPVRYSTLNSLLDLKWDELRPVIFRPTEGVLITLEETGLSRHTHSFNIRARHPVIASIIFAKFADTDDRKYEIINSMLSRLDPGYPEDWSVLHNIVKGRQLVGTIGDSEKRRAIYKRLADILPNDPFVLQHRAILEKDLGDGEAAVRFARQAAQMNTTNVAIRNTLGHMLEFASRSASPLIHQKYVSEAEIIFSDQIQRNPSNSYAYLGRANVKKNLAEREPSPDGNAVLRAEVLGILHEACDATNNDPVVVRELAKIQEMEGEAEEALQALTIGVGRHPENMRLRDLYVGLLFRKGALQEALEVATEGQKFDPTAWRIQRHLARIKSRLDDNVDAVKGHYEAALRFNKGDVRLHVELGAYLFCRYRVSESELTFEESKQLKVSEREKRSISATWREVDGKPKRFVGRVTLAYGAFGLIVAEPEGFQVPYLRNMIWTQSFRAGDQVRFEVNFNAHGPLAKLS